MVVVTIGAAFGVLSGRGAMIGMLSAAAMTMVTSLVGGSRYGVSSPTGPMTAAVAVILLADQEWIMAHYPDVDPVKLMNLTVIVAGFMLALFSLLKVHRAIKWIPQLAVSGFVNGIAVLIILSQFQTSMTGADLALLAVTFVLSMVASRWDNQELHLVWRVMAGSFGVILLMSLVSFALSLPVTPLQISGSLSDFSFMAVSWDLFGWETAGIIVILAVELALIALLDTLLTAMILDKKTGTKTQHRRELAGQSLSFFSVSLFGGLPGAQSTVPSMMMVEEGNHHRFSKLLLGALCVALTVLFVDLLQYVPAAVFGGVIVKIAVDVADLTAFKTLLKSDHSKRFAQLFLILAVLLSTVLISLNLAVIGCTLFFVFWNQYVPKSWRIPDLVADTEAEGLSDEI